MSRRKPPERQGRRQDDNDDKNQPLHCHDALNHNDNDDSSVGERGTSATNDEWEDTIECKDQGLSLQVFAAARSSSNQENFDATTTTTPALRVPSNLDYKDQILPLQDLCRGDRIVGNNPVVPRENAKLNAD